MSITLLNRDFTDPLDQDVQNLLDEISDFEFITPDGLVFKMSDINNRVPIYLDLKKSREERCEMKWKDLNNRIAKLEREFDWLDGKKNKTKEECDKHEMLGVLIRKLKKIRDDYNKSHPNPSPDDKLPIVEEIELQGYYTRDGKSHKPEIVLLMDLSFSINRNQMAITLIHEMFHAFYDYDLNGNDISVPFVEEPLTEYGMLRFVEALASKDKKYDSLLDRAQSYVHQKQFSCGVAHYGFGHYLWKFENENSSTLENIHWIDAFRAAKYRLSKSTPEYKKFVKPFNSGFFPFDEERYYMALLRIILLNADGANLSLPTKKQTNSIQTAHWNKFAPNAYWVVQDKTLYLEGDFSSFLHLCEADRYMFLENLCYNVISKIVLCDHFSCDDFYFVKRIVRKIGGPIQVKLAKKNQYYSEERGAIYDVAKTMLLYCPTAATRLAIPIGVKRIHKSAFVFCEDLKHVSIPTSVEDIPNGTFYYCDSLEDEIISKHRLLFVPKTATNYKIPAAVKEIDNSAFDNCDLLKKVVVPSGTIKEIQHCTFSYCKNLESVTIEEGLEKIEEDAFCYCKLTQLTLPASLKEIDSMAFSACFLESVIFKGIIPPKSELTFEAPFLHYSCIIYVPAGCKTDYEKLFPEHTVVEN